MVEREVEVLAVDGVQVRLRPISACRGCGGCGGRCALIHIDGAGLRLDLDHFSRRPVAGQRWRLSLEEAALFAAARRGYGRPLAGLLAGAVAGVFAAFAAGLAPDLATLLGASAGLLLGLRASAAPVDSAGLRALPCIPDSPSPQHPAAAASSPGPHPPEEPSLP